MHNPNSHHTPRQTSRTMSIGTAILAGHLIVNLPVLGIVAGALWMGVKIILAILGVAPAFPNVAFFLILCGSFVFGVVVAWLWWAYFVPRWRRWAIRNGASPDRLHRWAVLTGLEWRKGSPFERTEFRPKN